MSSRAFITGVSGLELTAAERDFIRAERPWGFILFKRNIETPAQVVCACWRIAWIWSASPDAPVLIDQEGGRVQRLGPPHWPVYPPGAVFGALYDIDPELGLTAARLSSRLIAADLLDLGITVDCLPLADVPVAGRRRRDRQPGLWHRAGQGRGDRPGRHRRAGAGRRAAGAEAHSRPWQGHSGQPFPASDGRYAAGSSWNRTDFAAFQPLADLPMAMTAHVVFSALDPAHPATTSATIIEQVIRGVIGFQGLLMSDDVSMNALAGSIAERTRAIVDAGCDMVLHCNGKLDEMREVARETPELAGEALERAERALASRKPPQPLDRQAARAELDALMERVGTA